MTAPDQVDRLLSVSTVATMLGVDPTVLYQWRARREGPRSFKVGRLVRYRESELLAWIAVQEAATARGGDTGMRRSS